MSSNFRSPFTSGKYKSPGDGKIISADYLLRRRNEDILRDGLETKIYSGKPKSSGVRNGRVRGITRNEIGTRPKSNELKRVDKRQKTGEGGAKVPLRDSNDVLAVRGELRHAYETVRLPAFYRQARSCSARPVYRRRRRRARTYTGRNTRRTRGRKRYTNLSICEYARAKSLSRARHVRYLYARRDTRIRWRATTAVYIDGILKRKMWIRITGLCTLFGLVAVFVSRRPIYTRRQFRGPRTTRALGSNRISVDGAGHAVKAV